MNRILLASLIMISILLASCSGLRPSDEDLLRAELKRWESFEGNGIAEISALGFSLRKPFVIAKSVEEMRMDLIEGGLLGASGSPLMSVYLGRYFAMKSLAMPILEKLNLQDKIPEGTQALFATSDYLFDKYGAEIIREKAVTRDSLSVKFSDKYRLESVIDSNSGTRIDLSYTRSAELDEIAIRAAQGVSMRLIFDEITYSRPQITPLPKGEPGGQNLMELFQGVDMMKLFQGIMGN